jgi:thiamine pyrophosphokinase
VLNGNPPGKHLLKSLVRQADVVVAADGGCRCLLANSLPFDAVVGDLDSCPPEVREAREGGKLVHVPEQDTTDAEKALLWVLRNTQARSIVLTATQSDETDHELATLSVCAKYASRGDLTIVEEHIVIYLVTRELALYGPVGATVSLLGIGQAFGVRTEGLRWEIPGEDLALGRRDGVRNELVSSPARITVKGGCLGVFVHRGGGRGAGWPG